MSIENFNQEDNPQSFRRAEASGVALALHEAAYGRPGLGNDGPGRGSDGIGRGNDGPGRDHRHDGPGHVGPGVLDGHDHRDHRRRQERRERREEGCNSIVLPNPYNC